MKHQMIPYALAAVVSVALLSACGSSGEMRGAVLDKVQRFAAQDMVCNVDEVNITRIDDRTFEAQGCENTRKYIAETSKGMNCDFNRASLVDRYCEVKPAPAATK